MATIASRSPALVGRRALVATLEQARRRPWRAAPGGEAGGLDLERAADLDDVALAGVGDLPAHGDGELGAGQHVRARPLAALEQAGVDQRLHGLAHGVAADAEQVDEGGLRRDPRPDGPLLASRSGSRSSSTAVSISPVRRAIRLGSVSRHAVQSTPAVGPTPDPRTDDLPARARARIRSARPCTSARCRRPRPGAAASSSSPASSSSGSTCASRSRPSRRSSRWSAQDFALIDDAGRPARHHPRRVVRAVRLAGHAGRPPPRASSRR